MSAFSNISYPCRNVDFIRKVGDVNPPQTENVRCDETGDNLPRPPTPDHASCLREELAEIFSELNITIEGGSRILRTIKNHLPQLTDLPADSRTLLQFRPPESCTFVVDDTWRYYVEDLKVVFTENLILNLSVGQCQGNRVKYQISIDGVPLFVSSSVSFWVYLGNFL